MNLFEKVLNQKDLMENPPVLLDIGASGRIHPGWKMLAKYSVCIAFDADERDFDYVNAESSNYRKLHVFNCIVSNKSQTESDFYLTKSPHCSSLLEPDHESLKEWSFASFFDVERKIRIKTENLRTVLDKLDVQQIDWFKTDSQGIDLKLFKVLGDAIIKKILVAEFEPGLMDAYKNEDKIHQVLAYMDEQKCFWLADMILKGIQRIPTHEFNSIFKSNFTRKLARHSLKKSPGWAELIYMNSFNDDAIFTLRDYLLAWLIASLKNQHGFALKIIKQAEKLYSNELLVEMQRFSYKKLKSQLFSWRLIPYIKLTSIKRFFK